MSQLPYLPEVEDPFWIQVAKENEVYYILQEIKKIEEENTSDTTTT